ncbi:MAG TPA: hypothetical protein VGL27_13090, partial [Negativicutes bacterium]
MARKIAVMMVVMLIITIATVAAGTSEISFSCIVPYSLGKSHSTVGPGESMRAFFSIESSQPVTKVVTAKIELPPGFTLLEPIPDLWQVATGQSGMELSGKIELAGGYGHWFELIGMKSGKDIEPGQYKMKITVSDEEQSSSKEFPINVQSNQQIVTEGPLTLANILLPLDHDGVFDERLQRNTLNLRDQSLDYYKNIFRGKGAVNTLVELAHPVAYMGLEFSNPAMQQKLLLVTAQLLDKNT